MKRKSLVATLALALTLVFAVTAVAVNEYTVNSSVSPRKSGTKARPVPVSTTFGFQVRDTEGLRPLALDALRISFAGIRFNTNVFPGCSASRITQAQSDSGCPRGSLIGTGFARNLAGPQNDRSANRQLPCYLSLRLHNSRNNRMALFVRGAPNEANPSQSCPIPVSTAIPVSITKQSNGDRFSFVIPNNLKNPGPGIRNSLIETRLTLTRRTRRFRGRTRGMVETIGSCGRNGTRPANVTFQNEGGNTVTQSGQARCSR
jgi:hypothetical protein